MHQLHGLLMPADHRYLIWMCRGEGSFGILSFGSCGYTNGDGSIPFPNDAVAAPADANPDFPGSCGRCYEVRCKPGLVLGECMYWDSP
jgi:hypothetical protein